MNVAGDTRRIGDPVFDPAVVRPGAGWSDITLETFSEKIEVRAGVQCLVPNFVKDYFPALGISIPVIMAALIWLLNKYRKRRGGKKKRRAGGRRTKFRVNTSTDDSP